MTDGNCVVELWQYFICRNVAPCFPQCFFKCNLHCHWMLMEIQSKYFLWRNWSHCHFSPSFKGSFKFCEYFKIWCQKEKVAGALPSKSLMDFLSKWKIYRALMPQCFKVFLQRQIQIVQHVRIWIRKFERWNEAVLPSMHPNHHFVYLKIPSDALTEVVKMGWVF